ncbi:hypothetical protein Ddye_021713 [Dipteronia dyeriana]|uniref:Uncharacterized protein n=1 Tax=Dipteronia dyeriana TaxID=168575 RepID=A0AAD9WXT1_9ROSI|nr:hypothetical protein Ddye_021713 [Dipteronia dyeriana]
MASWGGFKDSGLQGYLDPKTNNFQSSVSAGAWSFGEVSAVLLLVPKDPEQSKDRSSSPWASPISPSPHTESIMGAITSTGLGRCMSIPVAVPKIPPLPPPLLRSNLVEIEARLARIRGPFSQVRS